MNLLKASPVCRPIFVGGLNRPLSAKNGELEALHDSRDQKCADSGRRHFHMYTNTCNSPKDNLHWVSKLLLVRVYVRQLPVSTMITNNA